MLKRIYNRLKWSSYSLLAFFVKEKRVKFENREFKISINNSHEFHRAVTFHSKEKDTLAWLKNYLGFDFVDIGANIGIYSLFFSKISQNSKIYSFEPDASSFISLVKNISVNSLTNIKAFCIAIGRKKGFYEMNFHEYVSGAGAGSIDSEYKFTNSKNKRKYIQQTLCMTLDDCAELIRPNKCIVKIDVDGPEYEIIESAKEFLSSKKVESVLIEINSKCENDKHKIFSLMQSYGFNKIYQGNWIDEYKMFEIANYFFFKSSTFNLTDKNLKLLFKEVILKVEL